MENIQPFLISLGLLSVGGIGLLFYKDKEFGLSLKNYDYTDDDNDVIDDNVNVKNKKEISSDEDNNDNLDEANSELDTKKNKKRRIRTNTQSNKKKNNQHKNTRRTRN